MQLFRVFACLVFLFAGPASRAAAETSGAARVAGGTPTQTGEFEAVVQTISNLAICSGTLISDDTVLTAAHCFCNKTCTAPYDAVSCDSRGKVLFRDVLLAGSTSQRANVYVGADVMVHPDYCNGAWEANDYAVLKLDTPASQFVQVEPLPVADDWDANRVGDTFTFVGYGGTNSGSSGNCDDTAAGTKRWGESVYTQYDSYPDPSQGATMVFEDSNVLLCPGDSGGPLINYRNHVAGVASTGSLSTNSNFDPTLLARDWITRQAGTVGFHSEPIDPTLPGFVSQSEYRVDWCLNWGIHCGAPAAHEYCRSAEGAGWVAEGFAQQEAVSPTYVLGDQQTCTGSFCDSFAFVQCADTARTWKDPVYRGYRVDWCATWATDCGQPGADQFCRATHGSRWYALDYVRASDVGPTIVIGDDVVCGSSGCDGFAEITCALDPYLGDVANDADFDTWEDRFDNCPEVPNPLQTDGDADSIGDACDPLDDGAPPEYVAFDVEDAELGWPMRAESSPQASGGEYVWVPNGAGAGGSAQYRFQVSRTGLYAIWGRVVSNSGKDDSFYVEIHGASTSEGRTQVLWDTRRGGTEQWVWDRVSDRGGADPVRYPLEAGRTYTLEVLQREDGTKLDRLIVTNDLSFVPFTALIEAESGTLTAPMVRDPFLCFTYSCGDPEASNRTHILVPNGAGSGGGATYTFTAPVAGHYRVLGRVKAPNGNDDSFYASIDGGPRALWDTRRGSSWKWDPVSDRNRNGEDVTFELDAGGHTLAIDRREDGTMLDQLLITNDPGFGPPDPSYVCTNCVGGH